MDNQLLLQQFSQLPEKAKEEALLFLDFLMSKYQIKTPENEKRGGFGSCPGIKMSDDFDAELQDFKDYMPE
ncbi:MAG: DUF2281 domain-containing protein [Microscillaceae bacterium]|nr:DUF2281 domain-containing protein [Microscillaceae bacterium]